MNSERLDQIIRLGVGPEFAELYDTVRAVAHDVRYTAPERISSPLRAILEAYGRCEASMADAEQAVADFKQIDGTPAELDSNSGLILKRGSPTSNE